MKPVAKNIVFFVGFMSALSPSVLKGEDADILGILNGAKAEASSINTLNNTIQNSSDAELQVLFRRINELADERPDLLDRVIATGLASESPVLRHQALWAVVNRATVLSITVDPSKSYADPATIKNRVGRVISLSLSKKDEANRTVSLATESGSSGNNRILHVVGDNIHFKTEYEKGSKWRLQGKLSLQADGSELVGDVQYSYQTGSWQHLPMRGSISLK